LRGFCKQLADRLYRYRALSIRKAFRVRKVSDEHARILKAVLDRDAAEAERLLQLHYEKTADIIRADLDTAAQGAATTGLNTQHEPKH
jgi:DNA-binding GntR family transcriptional regulator